MARPDRSTPGIMAVCALGFAAFGMLDVYLISRQQRANARVVAWEATQGTVLTEARFKNLGGDPPQTCRVDVVYGYSVRGGTYSSSQVWPDGSEGDCREAKNLVGKLHVGKRPIVYYNPVQPWEATVAREQRAVGAFYWVAGVFFGLCAVGSGVLSVTAWRGLRNSQAPVAEPGVAADAGPELQ